MASASGLSKAHRIRARDLVVEAALEGLKEQATLQYTQNSPARWDGINRRLKGWRGEAPRTADCSAFATWCVWNGLSHYNAHDHVNGASWRYGYTGTLVKHGKRVMKVSNVVRADLVLYGDPFGPSGHVAVVVGFRNGIPWVVSFGGEPGPRFLPYNYRPVTQIRRYI